MVRSALVTLCIAAVAVCVLLQGSRAFLSPPSQSLRGGSAAVAMAGAAAVASAPGAAEAFVYNGKEYFDITFGISPLAWFACGFSILFYGATLKNAALKYNKPYGTRTKKNPKPALTGKFQGKEQELPDPEYKAYK